LRVVDWYLGLSLGQKIVVGIAAAVGLLLASYFVSVVVFSSAGPREEGPPRAGAPAPGSPQPEGTRASASASAAPAPEIAVEIESARWAGGKAVVEGSWRGDLSSVHCDLLEGGNSGRAIDWWDRSVAAEMWFSGSTFSQEFVRAEGRSVEDRIDPDADYWAVCRAQFSGGWETGASAPVKGTPPG
jgi:hypothetical protein